MKWTVRYPRGSGISGQLLVLVSREDTLGNIASYCLQLNFSHLLCMLPPCPAFCKFVWPLDSLHLCRGKHCSAWARNHLSLSLFCMSYLYSCILQASNLFLIHEIYLFILYLSSSDSNVCGSLHARNYFNTLLLRFPWTEKVCFGEPIFYWFMEMIGCDKQSNIK